MLDHQVYTAIHQVTYQGRLLRPQQHEVRKGSYFIMVEVRKSNVPIIFPDKFEVVERLIQIKSIIQVTKRKLILFSFVDNPNMECNIPFEAFFIPGYSACIDERNLIELYTKEPANRR